MMTMTMTHHGNHEEQVGERNLMEQNIDKDNYFETYSCLSVCLSACLSVCLSVKGKPTLKWMLEKTVRPGRSCCSVALLCLLDENIIR
jgi:hypothetical protein